MWGKTKKFKSTKVDTLVGHGTRILGDVVYSGGLHVDGAVVGNVRVAEDGDDESVLILSEHGSIEGEVRVPNLLLNGEVIGDVHSSGHVELAERARLNGNLYYHTLEMATGAAINGKMVHREKAAKPLLEHKQEARPVIAERKSGEKSDPTLEDKADAALPKAGNS